MARLISYSFELLGPEVFRTFRLSSRLLTATRVDFRHLTLVKLAQVEGCAEGNDLICENRRLHADAGRSVPKRSVPGSRMPLQRRIRRLRLLHAR